MPKLTSENTELEAVATAEAFDTSDGTEGKRTLTQRDIDRVTRRWIISNTSAWNYERMQNVAFAWSLAPALQKICQGKRDLGAALSRHMAFFNTEMTIGSPILGAVLALEDQRSQGEPVSDDVIDAIKAGLMGPLAALGDSLYSSTLNALLLSFCMGLGLAGNALGPVIFIVGWVAITLGISFWGVRFGYKQGMDIMDSEVFSPQTIAKVTNVLSILGLVVIGGLAAGFVSVSTPITWGMGESVTTLQDMLDVLMPGLLPFLATGTVWFLHDRRNVSVLKLLGGIVVVGALCSLVGLLA